MARNFTARGPSEGWENEGGSLRAAAPEITHGHVATYKVGGYTYTNLADAEAQARRMGN
jgi:hypothetical protein